MTDFTFSSDELSRMQEHQEGHMMDTCVRQVYAAGSADAYGKPAETWTDGTTLPCGLRPDRHHEVLHWTEVVMADAQIRLPMDTTLNNRDRLKITKRHGVTITPVIYEILGDPMRGPSGLLLNLRLVP